MFFLSSRSEGLRQTVFNARQTCGMSPRMTRGNAGSLLLVVICAKAHCQQLSADLLDSRSSSDYLDSLQRPLADKPPNQLTEALLLHLRLSIPIDRAELQTAPVTQRITTTLRKSPDAYRYFAALQKIRASDRSALPSFFEGGPARPFERWQQAVAILKQHGYEEQSRLLSAVVLLEPIGSREMMHQPLADWLSFSGNRRKFLEKLVQPYLDKHRVKLHHLCYLVFGLYQHRKGEGTTCFLDFALRIGMNAGFASIERAQRSPYEPRAPA